jgi:sugar phosphate isomerase/epimerase
MKYACFTVGQPESTPEEALKQLKDAGYDGVEWRITNDEGDTSSPGFWKGNRCTLQASWSDAQFEEIAKMTVDLGLEVPSLGTYLGHTDFEGIERMMTVAKIFGAPAMRVNPGRYDGSRHYREAFDEGVGAFGRSQMFAKRFGVKLLVEMHPGNITPSASAAFQFVSNFSPDFVGTIHDAGNMINEGFENYQMGFEILGPYLAHVHVKNGGWASEPAEAPREVMWKGVATPMRKGVVDFVDVLRGLKKVGYDGWLSFEDFSQEKSQAERVKDNLVYIKEVEEIVGNE